MRNARERSGTIERVRNEPASHGLLNELPGDASRHDHVHDAGLDLKVEIDHRAVKLGVGQIHAALVFLRGR